MKAGDIYEPKSGNKYVAVNDGTMMGMCRNCCDCYNYDDDCAEQNRCHQYGIHYKKITTVYDELRNDAIAKIDKIIFELEEKINQKNSKMDTEN